MKKGFTLMELLAVIVVLAILSLVSIPIIGDVINTGREGATENSVNFYIKEVESKFSEWTIEGMPDDLSYDINSSNGNIEINIVDLNELLKLEGTVPVSGKLEINNDYLSNVSYFGYVMNATLEYEDGYVATYTYHTESDYKGNRAEITIEKK